MEKGQLWMVIGITIVVAVAASIATAPLTGSMIRLNDVPGGKNNVHTTLEIDAKFKAITNRLTSLESAVFGDGTQTNQKPIGTMCNQTCARLLRVTTIFNSSSKTPSDDKVIFTDVKTGMMYDTTMVAEGQGIVIIDGIDYKVRYFGSALSAERDRYDELYEHGNSSNY